LRKRDPFNQELGHSKKPKPGLAIKNVKQSASRRLRASAKDSKKEKKKKPTKTQKPKTPQNPPKKKNKKKKKTKKKKNPGLGQSSKFSLGWNGAERGGNFRTATPKTKKGRGKCAFEKSLALNGKMASSMRDALFGGKRYRRKLKGGRKEKGKSKEMHSAIRKGGGGLSLLR